jgi:gliding motility-associated protein GldC
MKHQSDIHIRIELDENRIPETITWSAPDGGVENAAADGLMLNVWDGKAKDLLRIDLWTKEMPVDDMKKFMHQSLMSMANTYERATDDEQVSADLREFARYFGETTGILPKRQG